MEVQIGDGNAHRRISEHARDDVPRAGEGPVAFIKLDQRRLQMDAIGLEDDLPHTFDRQACRRQCDVSPVDGQGRPKGCLPETYPMFRQGGPFCCRCFLT